MDNKKVLRLLCRAYDNERNSAAKFVKWQELFGRDTHDVMAYIAAEVYAPETPLKRAWRGFKAAWRAYWHSECERLNQPDPVVITVQVDASSARGN